ncbi:MAG TPA: His/Gly/Thr/Pro-type tRNA ligase C-terminal domain-containing protein, partial [Thermodesulfobacteriota bacterium]
DTASIGRLYRRQDEVGTLFCVTVDVQSLEDRQVTVRDRDTMRQERIPIERVEAYVRERITDT